MRARLTELLGIDRIIHDVGTYVPRMQLSKPIQQVGYRRQLGEIETEPGVKLPFWLLTPDAKSKSRRPLAVCAHGHDADGWNTYAGVYRDAAHRTSTVAKDGDIGVQAVKRGFVVLIPATRGLAEVASIPDPKGRHGNRKCRAQLIHCLLEGRTPVGERVWDIQRLLDWALTNVENIDPKKVLMVGNSGGGVMTVYVAALDERIRVAVPSCSFTSFTSSTGFVFHCDCCLVPRAQVELADMADIGALAAPRSLLAVHGRKDGLHSHSDVDAAMKRVRKIYQAAGADKAFVHQWGAARHKFYPEIMRPFIESAMK
jgi:poly(3-hydroxybutyrate) depolymerase